MLSSDMGAAGAASARYGVGSALPTVSSRRESADAGGTDPFADLVDRYADDTTDPGQPSSRRPAGNSPVSHDDRRDARQAAAPSQHDEHETSTVRQTGKDARTTAEDDRRSEKRKDSDENAVADDQNGSQAVVLVRAPEPVIAGDPALVAEQAKASGQAAAAGNAAGSVPAADDSAAHPAGVSGPAAATQTRTQSIGNARTTELLSAVRAAQEQRSTQTSNAVGLAASVVAPGQDAAKAVDGPQTSARDVAMTAVKHALARGAESASSTGDANVKSHASDAADEKNASMSQARGLAAVSLPGAAVAGGLSASATSGATDGSSNDPLVKTAADALTSGVGELSADGRVVADADASRNDGSSGNGSGAASHGAGRSAKNAPGAAFLADARQTTDGASASSVGTVRQDRGKGATEGEQVGPQRSARAAQAIAAFQAASVVSVPGPSAAMAGHAQAAATGAGASSLFDAELPTQLVHAIRVQFDNGSGEARVRLNPGFLGAVTVGVRLEGESVVASLHASDPQVRDWMRTNESMLRQSLADQGLHLERLVIVDEDAQGSAGEESAAKQDQQDQQPPRRPRRQATEGTFELVF